ncbi:hypothetical protein R5R35_004063 [Gryllus longicercus]|uniref:OTU domain-containing protein n=1 Tax=Gryllus longicercus TaxID=2509291 RepID=A0AAN9VZL7_9ORTH
MVSEKNIIPKREDGNPNAAVNTPLHILVKEAFENLAKEGQLDSAGCFKNENAHMSAQDNSLSAPMHVQNDIKTSNVTTPLVTNDGQKFTSCQTKADGNCFFHAVFGFKNCNGQYETTRAKEMRKEWHNFLSQYHSLKDENMPKDLKDQLKKIFTIFLNDPSYLTGRSDLINNLVNETNKKIRHSDVKVEDLKTDIVNTFCENKMFRKEIMDVICGLDNTEALEVELLRDQKTLKTRISECLEECALKLCPHLSKSQCQEMYNSQTIADLFLEDSHIYKNYVDAILNQEYFIFFEEIPILASLGNIKITIYRDNGNTKTVFEPNLNILGNYKSDISTRCQEQEVTIFHAGMHFSRAEIALAEVPKNIQLGIFPYQENRKDVTTNYKTCENTSSTLPEKQEPRAENQEEDILFSPTSTVLKIDTNLQLGTDNFRDLLTPLMKTSKLMTKSRLQVDAFPNTYEMA